MATIAFPCRYVKAIEEDEEVPFRPNLNINLGCPDCKNHKLVEEYSSGDLVCSTCGLVISDRIVDTRSEWRTFAGDGGDDPSRVGGPSNPFLDGIEKFETIISWKDGNTGVARDLNRAASRVTAKNGDKSVAAAFVSIQDLCDSISLPRTVSDAAKQLYRRISEEDMIRWKHSDGIIAACIFIACRQSKVARSFKEIGSLTRVPKKLLGQCFKLVSTKFETMAVGGGGAINTKTGESSGGGGEDLVARICSNLGLQYNVQSGAKRIAVLQCDIGILGGRSPVSVAAACVYFASHLFNQPKTVKEVAQTVGMSQATVKNAYKLLYPRRHELVEPEMLTKTSVKVDRLPEA